MGQAVRMNDVFEGQSGLALEVAPKATNATTNANLTQDDFWLTSSALAALADGPLRTAQHALKVRKFHAKELLVKAVSSNVGRGGKTLLVHVDSLPPFLRERWYAQHGIALHEKVDPVTGKTVMAAPEDQQADPTFQERLSIAIWRSDVIRPATDLPKKSAERAAKIEELAATPRRFPNWSRKTVTKQTIYNWVKSYDAEGLYGLIRKRRADSGTRRQTISRAWDACFAAHISDAQQAGVADDLTRYIRSLWGAGERAWRAISEKSATRLIELSRDLRVVSFDALPLGRCGDTTSAKTQFGVCHVNRRKIEAERSYQILAVKDKDNATFQDKLMPSIRRDYSDLKPRQIVVGDVHPVDVMMRRPDGSVVYPNGSRTWSRA